MSCNKKVYAHDHIIADNGIGDYVTAYDADEDEDEDIHRVVADHLHLRLASNLGHIGTHLKQDSDGRREKNFFFSSTKR